ncbi:HIT family protein [Vagococcus entomophilus]|uniref:HIT domain-containing protein n=1 Tax=Vagococcus entomophilus TaxID=1160095 RepID=A0A430AL05_9ENTE|nr:hypothetical protein [Vagococcus entomophilus]RSU08759.1 hypothetical protein CBF30_05935 [Vagococcus entomophilus]
MKWYENRILSANQGKNPMVMKELNGGYAAFGDVQFLPGYCVLLPKREVGSLNELTNLERKAYLLDMAYLGDAILASAQASRVNYDILGNTDQYLHAHVFPRYHWEPEERRKMPVWLYDKESWINQENLYSEEKHGELRKKITHYLHENFQSI